MREQYGNPVFGRVTQEYPVADTEYGKVAGENRNGIAVFRGIPYGGSCDGNNRFLPAREPKAWTGIRDCRKNGPIAVPEGCRFLPWNSSLRQSFLGRLWRVHTIW